MKKFNFKIFAIASIVAILLTFASWVGLEVHNSPDRSNLFLGEVGGLWAILRFPTFTFFWKFLYSSNNVLLFSVAVMIDCAFYGFIVERIFSLFNKKRKSSLV